MKNTKAKLRRKADKLWTQFLLQQTPVCEVCGKPAQQVHHFIPKGRSSRLRYNLKNGISICMGCHLKHHTGNSEISDIIISKRGQEWKEEMFEISHMPPDSSYLNIKYYKEILEKLQ